MDVAEGRSDDSRQVLDRLHSRLGGEPMTLGELARFAGPQANPLLLMLLALPEAAPLPVAGMSTIIAIPLILVSLRMVLRGADPRLPAILQSRRLPTRLTRAALGRLAGALGMLDRWSRPRWQGIVARTRMIGAMCFVLALIIALPIPFGNMLPALCIVGVALGLLQRDGVIVMAALVAALVLVAGKLTALGLAFGFAMSSFGHAAGI
ncbi:exopolysaccharide biosynthesis protein [Stappia sp.]|uniref:exopolysaccharide biosynthesis protein n=1 Tax=Stappia sp. TaxID=1870903 RepID=UPI0032D9881B